MTRFFHPVYLLYLLAAVLLSFHLLPGITTIGHDKQVFIYAGMAIWKGAVPYKDFFDHKPPIIFLLMALAWPLKHWGIFLVGVLSKWIAACFIDRTARHLLLPHPFFYPFLFLILILNPFVLMEGVLTREYAACFLAVLYAYLLTNNTKGFFTAGLLAALVFYTQQEELLPILPLLFWYWLREPVSNGELKWKARFDNMIQFIAGFLMFSLPIVFWLTWKNALFVFFHETISFNIYIYGSSHSVYDKFKSLIFVLHHTRYLYVVILLLFVHFYKSFFSANKLLHQAFFFGILIFLFSKTILGRIIDREAVYHYMLSLSTIITMSLIVISSDWRSSIDIKLSRVIYWFLLFMVSIFFWKNSFFRINALLKKRSPSPSELLKNDLSFLKNKDGQLYVMGLTRYIYLYNELNLLSPSPWIYVSQYWQELPFDPDGAVIEDITHSLDEHKTEWVVDYLLIRPIPQNLHQQKWVSYLSSRYYEVKSTKYYKLFKRRPNAKL